MLHVQLALEPDHEHYVDSSARLRGVSRTRLLRELFEIVMRDQLVLSILGDEDIRAERRGRPSRLYDGIMTRDKRKSKYYRKPQMQDARRSAPAVQRPEDDVVPPRQYDPDARHPLLNLRRGSVTLAPRDQSARTRDQMYEDLRRAVLNTGGEPIDAE